MLDQIFNVLKTGLEVANNLHTAYGIADKVVGVVKDVVGSNSNNQPTQGSPSERLYYIDNLRLQQYEVLNVLGNATGVSPQQWVETIRKDPYHSLWIFGEPSSPSFQKLLKDLDKEIRWKDIDALPNNIKKPQPFVTCYGEYKDVIKYIKKNFY